MKPDISIDGIESLLGIISNVKLKKALRFSWLPIECMASATFNLESKKLYYKLGCKETILGGKISLDVHRKHIEYQKRMHVPIFGALGRMGWVVLGARLTWASTSPHFGGHVSYHIGFELGKHGAFLSSPKSIRLKPRLFVGPIGLEAISQLEVTLPSSIVFEQGSHQGQGWRRWSRLGRTKSDPGGNMARALDRGADRGDEEEEDEEEEGFGLKLNIEELNVIIKL